jgi:hypothetical protein
VLNVSAVSGSLGVNVRFKSGTDDSSALYAYFSIASSSNTGGTVDAFARTQTSAIFMQPSSLAGNFSIDVLNPKDSLVTTAYGGGAYTASNILTGGFSFNSTTSFDSMSFITTTGTFTGKVSAYGYK